MSGACTDVLNSLYNGNVKIDRGLIFKLLLYACENLSVYCADIFRRKAVEGKRFHILKADLALTAVVILLSDEVLEELNEKLNIISANIGTEQLVDITYFVQDERKAGGEYVTHSGIVKRIDLYRRAVIMADATIIPIEDISQIESNLFSGLE